MAQQENNPNEPVFAYNICMASCFTQMSPVVLLRVLCPNFFFLISVAPKTLGNGLGT